MKHDGINFPINQPLITRKNKVLVLDQSKRKCLKRNNSTTQKYVFTIAVTIMRRQLVLLIGRHLSRLFINKVIKRCCQNLCYLSARGIASTCSRCWCLHWTVGTLSWKSSTAVGMSEAFPIFLAYLWGKKFLSTRNSLKYLLAKTHEPCIETTHFSSKYIILVFWIAGC